MFSDKSSFEMFDSVIMDTQVVDDTIILKCLYMNYEIAMITFQKVSSIKNYHHMKGNTISYIKSMDGAYDICYVNELIEPTHIEAGSYTIDWK